MRNIFVAMPNYSGELNDLTQASVDRLQKQINARGWSYVTRRHMNDSIIVRARAVLLAEFLASTCDTLFLLDDDIAWDADEAMKLLDYPVDFVGGVYRAKVPEPLYFVRWCDKPELVADPETGLLEVESIPAGFVKLSRTCVEKMVMAFPHLQFSDDTAPNGMAWLLFDFVLDGGRLWGEDFIFCKRWREIGGRIWIDPDMTLKHVGKSNKEGIAKVYTGNLGHWLRNRETKDVAA